MTKDQQQDRQLGQAPSGNQQGASQQSQPQQSANLDKHPDFDALANKKPEELTQEELRLMADTMPGEGPGD